MAETSYPLAGGGSVTDARYEKLMAEISGSGFLGNPNNLSPLMYADGTGRQVKVAASRAAVIRGFRWESDAAGLTQPLAANTSGFSRIDLGVLRLNRADFSVRFAIKQGTPASSPVSPSVTQDTLDAGVWEIPVGRVTVASTTAAEADANLPSIANLDVTSLEYYVGPPPIVGGSTSRPAHAPGLQFFEVDTGRLELSNGYVWIALRDPAAPQQWEDLNSITFTNTTGVPGSAVCGGTFVAPASGEVYITVGGSVFSSTNGYMAVLSYEVRAGATLGQGSVILANDYRRAVHTGAGVNTGGSSRVGGSHRRKLSGLTPGAFYNVQTKHWVDGSGGTGQVNARSLLVEPVRQA